MIGLELGGSSVDEIGVIESVEGGSARVKLPRGSGCSHCSSKNACTIGSGGERILEAENFAGGLAGDTVKVFISPRSVVLGAFFLYIFPVLAMISAYLIAYWATGSKTWGTSLSLVALVVSFFAVRPLEKLTSPGGHSPRIVEIISTAGRGGSGERSA